MRIWKWKLEATDVQTIEVPAGAKLLDVQMQSGLPNLWALCDENAPSTPRRIAIYGTGNPMQNRHDLVVTTLDEPKEGEVVTIEGVLAANRDFGAGYKYEVIVEDARVEK